MFRSRLPRTAAAAAALALLLPAGVAAYDFLLVPSVGVREEYNNNLFFSETDREDDWLLTVTPGLDMAWKTERTTGMLTGKLDWQRYKDNSDLDATDYLLSGRFTHQLTSKVRLAGKGEFRRESRADRHLEETGLVDESRNIRHNYGVSTEWIVTEKTTATANYAFEYLDYPTELQRDAKMHTVGIGLLRTLSWFTADTKALADLGYNRGDYEGVTNDTYMATVGLFRAVHELWSVRANVGVMYTVSEFESSGELRTSHSTGATGNASLLYKGERTNGIVTFFHGLSPAFGYEGAALRTSLVFSVDRMLLHDISAGLSGGVYRNNSDAGEFSTEEVDELSARLRPTIRWKQSRYLAFDAAYQYTWLENRVSSEKATRSIAYAGFTLSYPLFDE